MNYGLRDWAARQPSRIALEFESRSPITYGELEIMANRYANLFHQCGLQRGDHIAGILANGPEVVAAVWGACRSGLYYTPVAHTFSAKEVAYVVDNCEAKLIIADARFADKLQLVKSSCSGVRHFFATSELEGWQSLGAALEEQASIPRPDESHGMLMMYSSGTTGAPKGIWRPLPTSEKIGDGPPAFARDLIEIFEFSADTRFLSPAPLYHAAPLRWSLAIIASGGTAIIMDKFDAERALNILETRQITMSQWVPTMFLRMLNLPEERRRSFSAPSHIYAWHAAAPCSIELKRKMIEWWGPIINEYYSGTESVGLTRINSQEWLARPGSVGRAFKGILHILDEDDNEVAPGAVGRVYFDPPSKFAYFNEPEKTAQKTSKQGWQTLGEIGYADSEGWLFLTDRQDDMIISGGVNIYPQELEHAIEELDEVNECGVAGIADEAFGERPVAFVIPAISAPQGQALVDLITNFCCQRLGSTKQPYQIRIVNDLPRSEAGKLMRRELRKQLAGEVQTAERKVAQ